MGREITLEKAKVQGNTDTGFLKLMALIFMIVDHAGKIFFPRVYELRLIGRIAFPLYAWCLVVGAEYTRNSWKYALRLAAVGLIAQPFYMWALDHRWTEPNIFLTLLLALLGIIGVQKQKFGSQGWAPALAVVLGSVLGPDYGAYGVFFVLLLYAMRKSRSGLLAAFLCYVVIWSGGSPNTTFFGWRVPLFDVPVLSSLVAPFFRTQALCWMALPLILIPTKTRLRLPKWLGYAAYPLHLAVLAAIKYQDAIRLFLGHWF